LKVAHADPVVFRQGACRYPDWAMQTGCVESKAISWYLEPRPHGRLSEREQTLIQPVSEPCSHLDMVKTIQTRYEHFPRLICHFAASFHQQTIRLVKRAGTLVVKDRGHVASS
jgi:hypothetical protein